MYSRNAIASEIKIRFINIDFTHNGRTTTMTTTTTLDSIVCFLFYNLLHCGRLKLNRILTQNVDDDVVIVLKSKEGHGSIFDMFCRSFYAFFFFFGFYCHYKFRISTNTN